MNAIETAKTARELARMTMAQAKRLDNNHYLHRGVEVLPIDIHGERLGDGGAEFLEIREISGKQLRNIASYFYVKYGEECVEVAIQGGIDDYGRFSDYMEAMRNRWDPDYEPYGGGTWDLVVPLSELRR